MSRAPALAPIVVLLGASSCSRVHPPPVVFQGGACATVALKIDHDLAVVPLVLEGEELPFIVDTGSVQTLTMLSGDAERLHVRDNGKRRTISDAWGHAFEVRGLEFRQIALGTALVGPVPGWEARWSPGHAPPVQMGHVGRGILGASALQTDLPHGQLRWGSVEACGSAQGRRLPVKVTADGLESEVVADGRTLTVLWDTAATHTVLRRDRGVSPRKTTIGGVDVDLHFVMADLGGLPADGLIGMDFFRDHAVTFDFAGSAVFVDP